MTFDLKTFIDSRSGEGLDLYAKYVNPWLVTTAEKIGYDKHFVRGSGNYVYDAEDNAYLDLDGGSGVFILGRNHPRILEAMREMMGRDPASLISKYPHFLAGALGEALAQRTPGTLNKAIFTNMGGETVDGAMKFARRVTGRSRFVHLFGDYHGGTYGALSITDMHKGSQAIGGGFAPMLPDCAQLPRDDIDALKAEIEKGDVAAFIMEPVRGATMEALSEEYMREAQELCRKHGTLFIVDEILVGFGRTGKFFFSEHYGLEPDIMCISKGMSGGVMPVGAIMITDELHAKGYNSQGVFIHRSTFMENDFAMAAALATIHVLEDEGLIEKAAANGQRIVDGLRAMQEKYSMIADVRGHGMMIGIELQSPKSFTQKLSGNYLAGKGLLGHMLMMQLMAKHRVLSAPVRQRNMLRFTPPYNMSEKDIDFMLEALDDVFKDAHRFPDGIGQFMIGQVMKMAS